MGKKKKAKKKPRPAAKKKAKKKARPVKKKRPAAKKKPAKKAKRKSAKKKTPATVDKKPHAGGQPTKYKPKYCQALINFFDVNPWIERKIPHYRGKGKKRELVWTDYKIMPVRMPTLRKFAKSIGVAIRTVYYWIDRGHGSFQEEFLHAFTCAQGIRRDWLIDVGLAGTAPPASFKFVAVNVTDMRDTQEKVHDVTGDLAKFLEKLKGGSDTCPSKRGDKG